MVSNYGRLILITPDGTEQVFRLTASELTLGRDESNDIVLVDPKVSRLHARLACSDRGCVLIDAGSANGTFVNGQRLKQATLRSDDLIKLGHSTLRFEAASPGRSATAAAGRSKRARRGSAARQFLDQFLDDLIDDEVNEQGSTDLTPAPSNQATSLRHDRLLRLPHLVVYIPQKTWRVWLKGQETWTLGRSEDNDIVIDHPKVSRYHARIERHGNNFIIHDLDSANGTYLGQQRINRHTLRHTDTLNIGPAQVIFKDIRQIEPLVLSPKTERVPVIVIPGNFGSALWRGSEKIWPNVRTLLTHPEKLEFSPDNPVEARGIVSEVVVVPKVVEIEAYDRIGDYLQATLGYTRGQDLLEFAYDWRGDICKAAQQLAETIERWHPTTPPVIIAHSMGCLVSRYYVDCLGGDRQVKKLILIGGPNYGFPTALLMILTDNLSHFHNIVTALSGPLGKKMMHLFASFPGLYQMLPRYAAIFDQQGQPLNPYDDGAWLPSDKQGLLTAGANFFRALNHQATIPTTCIFGYGTATVTRLNIERDGQGRWQHVEVITSSDGDGFVPGQSAILEGADIHPIQYSHNQLYVNEDVLMRLKYELVGQGK